MQLLETVSGLAIGQLVAERATLVMRMAEVEDWDIVAATHKTGAGCSPCQAPSVCARKLSPRVQPRVRKW